MKKRIPFSLLITLSLFLIAACSPRSGDPITIIVPDGYIGVFKIAEDEKSGEETKKEEGRYVFTIPNSGSLTVTDMSPFDVFHKTIVQTKGGEVFPNGFLEMPEDTVKYFPLWTNTEGTTWFLIGTDSDYQAAQKSGRVRLGPDFLPDSE